MSGSVSKKHPGALAAEEINKHEQAVKLWNDSPERKIAMKEYPGEHIASRDGKVIEHFKDKDELFKAVRRRNEYLMPIVIDEMSPPKEKDFFDEIEEAINTRIR